MFLDVLDAMFLDKGVFLSNLLRYVGVIRFNFRVLHLLLIKFGFSNLCYISKSMMEHQQ